VLSALFTAAEDAPKGIFGPVSAYVKTRACPASWLIEKGELARIQRLAALKDAPPYEFSLTLEEDCPGTVTHSVFVTSPGSTPEAWLKWRSQFHGRKAAGHYGAALEGLKKAEAAGLAPTAELRFVSVNGELVIQNERMCAPTARPVLERRACGRSPAEGMADKSTVSAAGDFPWPCGRVMRMPPGAGHADAAGTRRRSGLRACAQGWSADARRAEAAPGAPDPGVKAANLAGPLPPSPTPRQD
jgi:hypothetical protein